MFTRFLTKLPALAILSLSTLCCFTSSATIVEFQTSQGNFKVNLHDQNTPKTVDNFLTYANDGSYNDTIIHRTVDNFIVQGGGARFEGSLPPTWIATNEPVINEPVYSNVRGTIAMAKQSGNENSATNQWFINISDNSTSGAQLDLQNGGFTVFGEVIEGMNIVDEIANIARCNTGYNGFTELPMPDFTCANGNVPGVENFVTINNIDILDSSPTTETSLSSVENTLIDQEPNEPTTPPSEDASGGGSVSYFILMVLVLAGFTRLNLSRKPS